MPEKDEGDLLTGEDRAFARAMQAGREERGWSQGELADRLAGRGHAINRVTVSRIEGMKRAARLGEAYAIAELLELPVSMMTMPAMPILELSQVLDQPRLAAQALEELRIAAVRVSIAWQDMRRGLELAEFVRQKVPPGSVEDELTEIISDHRHLVEHYLAIDPAAEVQVAMKDPTAIEEKTSWRYRDD